MKVAVYGSLRKGLGNHRVLGDSEFIGQFETEHKYSLVDLGSFPGLLKNGSTSVVMEVYDVKPETLPRLDQLEGYNPKKPNDKYNFYTREKIDSPLGKVSTYFLNNNNGDFNADKNVNSGDWLDYYKTKQLIN